MFLSFMIQSGNRFTIYAAIMEWQCTNIYIDVVLKYCFMVQTCLCNVYENLLKYIGRKTCSTEYLRWVSTYDGWVLTMGEYLRWVSNYDGRVLTMGEYLRWVSTYDGWVLTMGEYLRSVSTYDGWELTMGQYLRWVSSYDILTQI